MYLTPNRDGGCLGCMGNTQSGLGKTQSGIGDLSFDGTGIFGSGLFGYSPWSDTSQWTIVEWAALGAAILYGTKAIGWFKGRRRRK